MKKKILITGGAGYIGYHLVKQLLKRKDVMVTVIDSFIYENDSLIEFKKNKNLNVFKGDICNIYDMVKVVKNTDIVVALAAIVGDPACALNEEQTYSSNYHSTDLLIQLCNYYKVRRLIFASSCSVYGASDVMLNEGSKLSPLSLYAKTRIMSEELIKKNSEKNLEWTILRFGTVFGLSKRMRFDLVVNFLTANSFHIKKIKILGGDQWRPLVHVEDVANALYLSIFADSDLVSSEIFNVGDNRLNVQIKNIAEKIKEKIKKVQVNYENIAPADRRNYRVSFDKIRTILKFEAKHSIESGINEIITYLNKNKINYLDDKYYNVKYLFKLFKK